MSAKRKDFTSRRRPLLTPSTEDRLAERQPSWVIEFPENPLGVRTQDLSRFTGHGFDAVLDACIQVIAEMVAARSVRTASAVMYTRSGLISFSEFLMEVRPAESVAVTDINRKMIEDFIAWMRLKGAGDNAGRPAYNHMKAILKVLIRRGMVPGGHDIFPRNPYPQSNRKLKGEKRFTNTERARLAAALKQDLVAIGKGRFEGTGLEASSVLILSLALRTGLNTTPALDLNVDCLKPHPLVRGQYLLQSLKHRSKAVKERPTRESKAVQGHALAAGDVAAIIQFTRRVTEPLRSRADPLIASKLWLFEREDQTDRGAISVMGKSALAGGVRKIRDRHNLKGDDGEPMRLNVSRLRKTLSNSLWRLSRGDIRAVASALGNIPQVVEDHYLEVTEEMERDHAFVGRALVERWRGPEPSEQQNDVGELHITPVGSCGDPYHGDMAPKDGNPCIDFLSCFKCKSYVLVEDPKDLHRLFSFYFFLDAERERMGVSAWAERYGWILRLIDDVTSLRFNADTVATAKQKGREAPITFWRTMPRSGVIPNAQ